MSSRDYPERSDPRGEDGEPHEQVSVLRFVNVILRHRWVVLSAGLVAMLGMVGVTYLRPPAYTAHASFLSQESDGGGLGGAAALAGRLGLSLPTSGPGRSPQFYADLLQSREVLSGVLLDTLRLVEEPSPGASAVSLTLLEFLDFEGDTEALRRERGVKWLREEAIDADADRETGLVGVDVTTAWPRVSWQISNRLLELLNQFNLERRQTQALHERQFIATRLEEVERELAATEDRLQRFLETNRRYENSPELVFEHDRLQRQVAMRQQLYTSLNQAYEEARISEVRNTPVITVIESPQVPHQEDRRPILWAALIGLMAGSMFGLVWALCSEMFRQQRAADEKEYHQFLDLWTQTVHDLAKPFRRFTNS